MDYDIDEEQFKNIDEFVHLHFCKDSYINSNDFSLLLSEFRRNRRLKKIIGFVSPYTRFTKVLRQYTYGLDWGTQKAILKALSSNYLEKYDITLHELFSKNLIDIEITNQQFYEIFVEPILSRYKVAFDRVGLEKFILKGSGNTLHDKFLKFSNEVYKQISKNFNVPLLELRNLQNNITIEKSIDSKILKTLIEKELASQRDYCRHCRSEYRKLLKSYNGAVKFSHKKKIIERLDKDPVRSLRRHFFISDYDLIKFLETDDDNYLDLFKLDKVITKNLIAAQKKMNTTNVLKYVSTLTLLDKIFATKPTLIVTQKFMRDFDYSIYETLSKKYSVKIYPSSITTWKDDRELRFRNLKLISFVWGLNLFFKKYVQ